MFGIYQQVDVLDIQSVFRSTHRLCMSTVTHREFAREEDKVMFIRNYLSRVLPEIQHPLTPIINGPITFLQYFSVILIRLLTAEV